MVYLFLGKNDFTKRQRLEQLAKLHGSALDTFGKDNQPDMEQLSETTLFGGPRLFVLDNLIGAYDPEVDIPRLARSPHVIVFVEAAMDKRKKTTAQLLKHPDITVEEFELPEGPVLAKWVEQQVRSLGSSIDNGTAQYFIGIVLPEPSASRFAEPAVNLWQLYSELQKLVTYAAGQPVSREMIDSLTTKNTEVETWDIINALADRNTKKAFLEMEQLFAAEGLDDKTKTIQLNAALADQFRSILLVQDFLKRRVSDQEILSQTGWKSGRLFIMRKLAARFRPQQVVSALDKLERLDHELKTSNVPGQVILELIAAQL